MRAIPLLLLLALGCSETATLVVQVRTDLRAPSEFDGVEVVVMRDGAEEGRFALPADSSRDWADGVRVAELTDVELGPRELVVSAVLGPDVIVGRPVRVELEAGVRVVTVLLSKDCAGVMCPGTDDPGAIACLGGRCVPEECTEETPELCTGAVCVTGAECGDDTGCMTFECTASGTCFSPDGCGELERCDSEAGCVGCTSFTPPEPIPGVNTIEAEYGPSFGPRDLSLLFSTGDAAARIVRWIRDSTDQPFRPEIDMDSPIDVSFGDTWAHYSPSPMTDGAWIFFHASLDAVLDFEIFMAPSFDGGLTHSPPLAAFLEPSLEDRLEPSISADGLEMFFTREVGSDYEIYRATRDSLDFPFEERDVQLVTSLSSAFFDVGPHTDSRTGLELWFASRRPPEGIGGIFVARRASRGDLSFGPAEYVSDLSSPTTFETEPALSNDGRTIVFASVRPGGAGSLDLYSATRVCR